MDATATVEYWYNYRHRHLRGAIDRTKEYYGNNGAFDSDNFTPLRIARGTVIVPISDLKEFLAKYEKENQTTSAI